MIKEHVEYGKLSGEMARRLSDVMPHSVEHGKAGTCPSCGHEGIYDLQGPGLSGASIFFSAAEGKWRCMMCGIGHWDH